jgi:hypothetical protein
VSSLENWRRRLSSRKRQPLPPEKESFADGEVKITCDLETIKNQTAKLLLLYRVDFIEEDVSMPST